MRSLESKSARILAGLALAALVALPAIAGEDAAARVADLTVTGGSISWAPRVAFDTLVLTVDGGGFTITREFTGAAHFAPVDPDGFQLPDGIYTWELTAAPRAAAGRRPEADAGGSAAERANRAAGAPSARVQSGAFTIADGAIVDPAAAGSADRAAAPAEESAAAVDTDRADP